MMSPCVIFINGPKRSGKDTLANYLVETFRGVGFVQASRFLKEQTNALYGCPHLPWDWWEDTKDVPNDTFEGMSPRQAWIDVSERRTKPIHGKEFYGNLVVGHMRQHSARAWISDCGYEDEAAPILRAFGSDRCRLVRIHRDGHSFDGDSRTFIKLPGVETIDFTNNGTRGEFFSQANRKLGSLLQQMVGGE